LPKPRPSSRARSSQASGASSRGATPEPSRTATTSAAKTAATSRGPRARWSATAPSTAITATTSICLTCGGSSIRAHCSAQRTASAAKLSVLACASPRSGAVPAVP
jgi:hypothetical protein